MMTIKKKHTHKYGEQTGGCQSREGGAMVKMGEKGLRGTNFQL